MVLERIEKENSKHLYEVEIRGIGGFGNYKLNSSHIEVEANNRAQASSIVKKLGYEVCSVNMVG